MMVKFILNGKMICSYNGFKNKQELIETQRLLAHENNCTIQDIECIYKNYLTNGKDVFEIVDFIPYGYIIWNIGKNMTKGYIPLVQVDSECHVLDTPYKALKIKGSETIMQVAGFGSLNKMEHIILKGKENNSYELRYLDKIIKAVEILKTIRGYENLNRKEV